MLPDKVLATNPPARLGLSVVPTRTATTDYISQCPETRGLGRALNYLSVLVRTKSPALSPILGCIRDAASTLLDSIPSLPRVLVLLPRFLDFSFLRTSFTRRIAESEKNTICLLTERPTSCARMVAKMLKSPSIEIFRQTPMRISHRSRRSHNASMRSSPVPPGYAGYSPKPSCLLLR